LKDKILDILKKIYGLAIMYSVLVGALVAAIYIIGFIAGGSFGEQMAKSGAKVMNTAITVSAIGSVVGTLAFYFEGHELTMDSNKEEEEEVEAN